MQLYYHKRFRKQLHKLEPRLQKKTKRIIGQFKHNPRDPELHNHALSGKFKNERAISVTGDIRIVLREENNYQRVTLLRIGPHSKAYK